jgi:hypothetical protein
MVVNNNVKKGYSLSLLREIYANGLSIPVNLVYELRPIRTAIQIAETWLKESISLFKRIGISIINVSEITEQVEVNSDDDNDETDDDSNEEKKDDSTMKTEDVDDKEDLVNDDEDVSYSELCIQINRAANFTTEFEELTEARNMLAITDKWIQEVNDKCHHLKRKPTVSKDNKVINLNINKLKTIQELENLLLVGDTLKFSLEKEKKHIHDAIERSINWNIKAKEELNQILNGSLSDIVVEYKDLLLLNSTCYLPFHCFNGIDQNGEDKFIEDMRKDEDSSSDDEDDKDDKNPDIDESKVNVDIDVADNIIKEETLIKSDAIIETDSPSIDTIPRKTLEEIEAEKKFVVMTEYNIWNKTKLVMYKFSKLLNESDEIGILDDVTLLIRSCCGVLQWIHQVKLLLGSNCLMSDEDISNINTMNMVDDSIENDSFMSIFSNSGNNYDGLWGDISKNNISLLLKDGLALVPEKEDDDDGGDADVVMVDGEAVELSTETITKDKEFKKVINVFTGTTFESYGFDFARNIVKTVPISSTSSITPASRRSFGSRSKSKVEEVAAENDENGDEDEEDDDDNKSVISTNSTENDDNKKRRRENINWSEKLNTRNANSAASKNIKVEPVVEPVVETVVKKQRGGSKPGHKGGSNKGTITSSTTTNDTNKEVVPIAKRKYKDRGSKYDKPTTTVTKEKEEIKNDIKLSQFLTHLVTYFDHFSITLPTIMKDYIDIFIRIICFHNSRMVEVEKWKSLYKKLATKSFACSAGSNSRKCKSEVTNLLAWANRRHIETKAKLELEAHIFDCNDWVIKSNSIKETAISKGKIVYSFKCLFFI